MFLNRHKYSGSFYIFSDYFEYLLVTAPFYSSYLATYLEKDLTEILKVDDEVKFVNFFRLLSSNTAEELVYDNYAKQVGVTTNTIKAWMSALVKTGVIYLVEPYNEKSIVKRIVKRPKMYFFDTGLAAYLCWIDSPETLRNSFLKERFFETFVFNELRKSYVNAGINQQFYYYRDTNQNEVDLVLIRDERMSLIEIKTGQNFSVGSIKAFSQLSKTELIKAENAVICTADTLSMLNEETYIVPVCSI